MGEEQEVEQAINTSPSHLVQMHEGGTGSWSCRPDIFLSVETGEGQVVQLSLEQVYQLAQWLAGREADEDAGLLERVEGGAGPRHQA